MSTNDHRPELVGALASHCTVSHVRDSCWDSTYVKIVEIYVILHCNIAALSHPVHACTQAFTLSVQAVLAIKTLPTVMAAMPTPSVHLMVAADHKRICGKCACGRVGNRHAKHMTSANWH